MGRERGGGEVFGLLGVRGWWCDVRFYGVVKW